MSQSSRNSCDIQLNRLSLPPADGSSNNSNLDALTDSTTQAGEADPSSTVENSSQNVNSAVQATDDNAVYKPANLNQLLSKETCSKLASYWWQLLVIIAGLLVTYMAYDLALWTAAKDWKAYCDDLQHGGQTIPGNCKEAISSLLSPPPWHGHWLTGNSTTRIRRDLLSTKRDIQRLKLYLMASKLAPRAVMIPSQLDLLVVFFVVIITVVLGLTATVFILVVRERRSGRENELQNFSLQRAMAAGRNYASVGCDQVLEETYNSGNLQPQSLSHNELEVHTARGRPFSVTSEFSQSNVSNPFALNNMSSLGEQNLATENSENSFQRNLSDPDGTVFDAGRLGWGTMPPQWAATMEGSSQEGPIWIQTYGNVPYTTSSEYSEQRSMAESSVFSSTTPPLRPDGIRKRITRFEIPQERNLQNIDALILASTDENEKKELKQQKRLLRNRQAALDSRQRKKTHTEKLEQEKKVSQHRIMELENAVTELTAILNGERVQWKSLSNAAT